MSDQVVCVYTHTHTQAKRFTTGKELVDSDIFYV